MISTLTFIITNEIHQTMNLILKEGFDSKRSKLNYFSGTISRFLVLKELSFRWIFVLGAILISVNAINQNYVEATSDTPLIQFTEYREEYGKDTARVDMKDNGFIDNSINSVRFEHIESETINYENEGNNLLITRTVPDSAAEFFYHWEQDDTSVSEYSSYINEPLEIIFLDEKIVIPDDSASEKLLKNYGILLSNEGEDWQFENTYALLEVIDNIPQVTNKLKQDVTSKWILTTEHIDNDIRIIGDGSVNIVEISVDAFENSNPKIVQIDDKKGKYFSYRLHHALVWFVTDEGNNLDAIEYILNKKFGVSTNISDYSKLTKSTTNESEKSFQQFHSWELLEIISTFEEMPDGFHSIEGLNYLVRRSDGTDHPLYPSSPAVAWASVSPGYVEFMETAFTKDDNYLHRLIIHEKSHFLWGHVFSDELKHEWNKLGGWYKDNSQSGWSTTKTTEFVSAYSHLVNPNEDMAESISYFIINPDKLKSRSLPKYEFIKNNIMGDAIYLTGVREDLTFNVLNLNPDYIYPGKIIRVDISITGKEQEKKHGIIEIEINGNDNFEGSKSAYLRLYSEIGTYKDVSLRPIDDFGFILRGEIMLSEYAKSGLWNTNQITISDQSGNQRFEGQNNFGWKFFVNNPNEDIIKPKYVQDSLELTKRDTKSLQQTIQIISVNWKVDENQKMDICHAKIDHESNESYSFSSYGVFDIKNNECNVDFKITDYFSLGNYIVKQLKMIDVAGNTSTVGSQILSNNYSIFMKTNNEDVIYPNLDVNDITISAKASNQNSPSGETEVKIVFYASDDKSGLGQVSYRLQDPQGIQHNFYHYHENFHSLFFDGQPKESKRYDINLILPEGSAPGKWALTSMTLSDKANNKKTYEFTEVIHFETG
jgi:hypothetical protein